MIAVHVNGGTGAGRKLPLRERRWMHWCGEMRPATPAEADEAYWSGTAVALGARMLSAYSCPDCGARRPARPFPTNSTAPVIIER